jgi:hypothetical protein
VSVVARCPARADVGGWVQITSVLVVGGAFGEMAVPLLLVSLFRTSGTDNLAILMPVLTAVCVANVFVLVAFILVRRVASLQRLSLSLSVF